MILPVSGKKFWIILLFLLVHIKQETIFLAMIKRFFKRVFHRDNIIKAGIGVIAILILHNFVVALYNKRTTREYNEFVVEHRDASTRIDQIGTNVNLIDLGLRGYFMIPKPNLKEPLEIARRQHRENIDSLEVVLSEIGYAHIDSLHMVDNWIGEYFDLADQGVAYIDQGMPEKAVELFASDPGYTLWSKYSTVQNDMKQYINTLNEEKLQESKNISLYAFVAQLLLAFLGCLTLVFVVYKLIQNEKDINNLFGRIRESDRNYVYNEGNENEQENNEQVIGRMIRNLRHASDFIKDVSRGNLDVQWKGLTSSNIKLNEGTLAGELINMRDQMVRVKTDEGNRMWVSEGISIFSEIIRRNQDNLREMSDKLLAKIVKYMDANQGGLFFISEEEEDKYLELTSCYAYDKKKFNEKRIPVDSGMLGQAYLEGSVVLLKEIPADYIHITSGLGEATPGNLILVPLKFNEQVIGVLELASFEPFSKIHLELLEKISEIVASAVVNSRNSEKMQELLENAQQTAEEMRAQEEEMRQNMEELQATQEELARKESELLKRISELEKENKSVVINKE